MEMDTMPLWIVAQVEGTGHQSNRVTEPAVTGWVNLWVLPGSGSWYRTNLSNGYGSTGFTTWYGLGNILKIMYGHNKF